MTQNTIVITFSLSLATPRQNTYSLIFDIFLWQTETIYHTQSSMHAFTQLNGLSLVHGLLIECDSGKLVRLVYIYIVRQLNCQRAFVQREAGCRSLFLAFRTGKRSVLFAKWNEECEQSRFGVCTNESQF